jgi:hypothetical protein
MLHPTDPPIADSKSYSSNKSAKVVLARIGFTPGNNLATLSFVFKGFRSSSQPWLGKLARLWIASIAEAYKTVRLDFVGSGKRGGPSAYVEPSEAATREDSPAANALQDAVPVALPRAAFGCACGRSDSDLRRLRRMIRSASYPEPDVSPSTNGSRISRSANPTIASTRSRLLH